MKNIPLAKPLIGRLENRAVGRVLKSGGLAQGPEVAKFEKMFSKHVGEQECVAVNSGTSGLHIALLSLGIGSGDEVIVPSFTFAATANCVALAGAVPVFVDIDPVTFNLDPEKIESAISKKTKAIVIVHLYGLPASMDEINKIAKKYSLLVVEDAAQAHMAAINDQPVGTFGDAAVFSFYPTKNMTSGEGGMVVLRDSEVARRCRLLRNQGMEIRYQNEVVGFNLRMTDIHASIGIVQLRRLPVWTEKRIQNANFLSEKILSARTPLTPHGYRHVFHQFTIRIEGNRDLVSEKLTSRGIGNAVYYPTPVHRLPSFDLDLELTESDLAAKEVLAIPIHPSLTRRQLKRIATEVESIVDGLK
jgi:dTDP-4-amino-4,6-dideoxygalactose transaminase